MTCVTLDAETLNRLSSGDSNVKVCDSTGRVVGVFFAITGPPDPSEYEYSEPDLSDEEWRRRAEEPGGRPLADILADLQKRK